jgi:sodium transport system permease protein
VERFALLAAKYVAVVLVALITATVNLGMMIVTLSSLGMWSLIFGERGFSWLLLLQMFALMPLFACFFASILLAITSFARSFKEAQAYLIPVILVSMVPGFAALMPGMELQGMVTVVPLLNIVLLGRDLLSRSVDPFQAWLAIAATVVYALGGLAIAARIFGAEAVLYGSQESWGDLWRRPRVGRPAATPAMAAFCLAVVFPVFFIAGGFMAKVRDWSIAAQLAIASLATSAVFALLPLLFAVWNRIPLRDGFMLRRPRVTGILAAVLLGLSMWTAAHEIILLLHQAGLVSISGEHFNRAEELLRRWREAPVALVVLTIGVAPGVCEEFFFRGFLLRSLLTKMAAWRAVLTSGLLFGAFHLITTDLLAVERFLPSALLGCVLGWLCLRGGSVLVSMLAHSLHNSLLVAAAYYQPWLTKQGIGIQEQSHLPSSWLASAGVMAVTAAVLLSWGPERKARTVPTGDDSGQLV